MAQKCMGSKIKNKYLQPLRSTYNRKQHTVTELTAAMKKGSQVLIKAETLNKSKEKKKHIKPP